MVKKKDLEEFYDPNDSKLKPGDSFNLRFLNGVKT
jgi:hypothetical protein